MVRVPDLDAITQARRFGEVDETAKSLIAITLDVPDDSFEIRTELEAIEDINVTERLDAVHDQLERAEALAAKAQADKRALAHDLATIGVTLRDIGAILGMSFQRAQQLVRGK
jgi:hypothetical protein